MNFESFEKAFSDNVGTCRAQCACGKEFYDKINRGYDWEEGEFEALEADPDATGLDCSVGYISFEGQTFVMDCDCWKERAQKIGAFIDAHMDKIARYFREERTRRTKEAEAVPSI